MYYLIDNDENLRYDNIEDVLDYCVSVEYFENDTDGFNDYLNEDGSIEIEGYEYYPADILWHMDRDAYNRELHYWAENQIDDARENGEYELEHTSPGESCWICNSRVYVYDDDEDEEEEDNEESAEVTVKVSSFEELEIKLTRQKEDEENILKEEENVANNFISALGIQVI